MGKKGGLGKKGGFRKGAGRKPTYTEKTVCVNFKVPVSAEVAVRELVKNYLVQYLITKQDGTNNN